MSESDTRIQKILGTGTKVVVIAAILSPQIGKAAMKGLMFKTLWFWISAMQLYNAMSLLSVDVPENVLNVQQEFNDIIYL